MNYPGKAKSTYNKIVSHANRGMDLENLVNTANDYYLNNDLAIIYKKPTPIQVVKYDYTKKRITDAYYKEESTLDYNGIYKGKYIEFDAKETKLSSFPLNNIAKHQIDHIKRIINHHGIVFLIIMIKEICYILPGKKLIEFINTNKRKSIPYDYIKENGISLEYNYLKGVNYLPGLEKLIKGEDENESI